MLELPKTPDKIFEKTITSVVEVKAMTDEIESLGNAVIISDAELITNFHVISYANQGTSNIHDRIEIRIADESDYKTVDLIKYNENLDFALLSRTNEKGEIISGPLSIKWTGKVRIFLGSQRNSGHKIKMIYEL